MDFFAGIIAQTLQTQKLCTGGGGGVRDPRSNFAFNHEVQVEVEEDGTDVLYIDDGVAGRCDETRKFEKNTQAELTESTDPPVLTQPGKRFAAKPMRPIHGSQPLPKAGSFVEAAPCSAEVQKPLAKSESFVQKPLEKSGSFVQQAVPLNRVKRAQCTMPMDLCFEVPPRLEDDKRSEHQICLDGPHGPLMVQIPPGMKPGEQAKMRLGPTTAFRAVVPDDKAPGDEIYLTLPNEEMIKVIVPEGKQPGDNFDISPPVLMVQVPEGAAEGEIVMFTTPNGQERTAVVPAGKTALQYFDVPL